MSLLSDPLTLLVLAISVILLGLAKGGLSGVGALATPIVALVLPPTLAAALLLPILIVQDVVSVWSFRRTWDGWIIGWMLPGGPKVRSLSKLQMGGMGRAMVEREMRLKGIAGLAEQMEMAKSTGIQILVCSMTMDLMGIRREELVEYPGLEVCGTTKFIDIAASGNVTFFI